MQFSPCESIGIEILWIKRKIENLGSIIGIKYTRNTYGLYSFR